MSNTGSRDLSETRKPLAGLRVVELGTLIAGPFCTRILGEFGAEVIKVEAPGGGDPLRKWRQLYEGTSLWWTVQVRWSRQLGQPPGKNKLRPVPERWF